MKNNKRMPKRYIKVLSNIFLWTSHNDPWCNMLPSLERRGLYISVILSDEHTLKCNPICIVIFCHDVFLVQISNLYTSGTWDILGYVQKYIWLKD